MSKRWQRAGGRVRGDVVMFQRGVCRVHRHINRDMKRFVASSRVWALTKLVRAIQHLG